MHTITHPTPTEIDAFVRRGRALRSNAVCAFFNWLAAGLARRRTAKPTVKWA